MTAWDAYRTPSLDPNRTPPGPSWLRAVIGDGPFQHVVSLRLQYRGPRSDAAMAALEDFPRLRKLYLGYSQIPAHGFASIGRLNQLDTLDLTHTNADAQALRVFDKLGRLRFLGLDHTKVDDGALEGLTPLTSLEYLDLSYTTVTAQGLASLRGLRSLRVLYLEMRRVLTTRPSSRFHESVAWKYWTYRSRALGRFKQAPS